MQCIWSTAARTTPWNYARWRTNLLARDNTRLPRTMLRKTIITSSMRRATFATTAPQKDMSSHDNYFAESGEPSTVPLREEDSPHRPMTAAQLSRAAAAAVRQCVPPDALYIVNSLHFSTYGKLKEDALRVLDETRRSTRLPFQKYVEFKPIEFGQPVSPRLSAHCFLHMLIRRGHSYQASNFAQLMVENGLRVKTLTMESVIKAVCASDHGGLLARHQAWAHPSGPVSSLKFSRELFYNIGHEAAFRILQLAREQGQRRTEAMYDTLISACLLQGEIIIAALLFACLAKDWQVRSAAKKLANPSPAQEACSADIPQGEVARQAEVDRRLQWMKKNLPAQSILYTPYPDVILLKKITHRIELAFSRNLPPDKEDGELQEAMQALAVLTGLIEDGHIHFGKISPILRALYHSPKSETRVWKYRRKEPVSVRAYTYFHDFLKRLIRSLRDPSLMATPRLDSRACNSLLHYSLRHRLSPKLAAHVMEYMLNERGFRPDIVTMNVLLRSGTVLRREDLVGYAIKGIRPLQGSEGEDNNLNPERGDSGFSQEYEDNGLTPEHEHSGFIPEHDDSGPNLEHEHNSLNPRHEHSGLNPRHDFNPEHDVLAPSLHAKEGKPHSRLAKALVRLTEEPFQVVFKAPDPSFPLQADEGTIVSYISHLASTGGAQLIADVLFDIIPELVIVPHPAWGAVPAEERHTRRLPVSRKEALQQAVLLGPRFFSAVLNALAKADKVGLAERVWILAKTAEKVSWVEGFAPGSDPWYLPIAAYTSMMQCYADQSQKGLPRRHVHEDGGAVWIPRERDRVTGWGMLQHRGRATSGDVRNRHDGAKAMGSLILRNLVSSGKLVVRQLLHLEQLLPSRPANGLVTRPEPDARFWNAALALFRPAPWMLPRRPRNRFSRTRRFLRWSLEKFRRTGSKSIHWDPVLQEIVEAMLNNGYPLPPAFRHLFIGRHAQATDHFPPPIPLDCSPFAFPRPRYRHRPHALPTSKTRGLPLRRVVPRPRRKPVHARA